MIDDEQPENNIQDNDDLSTDFIEPEPSDILNDTIRIAKISDSTGDGRRTLVYASDFPYGCSPELLRVGYPDTVSLLNGRDRVDGSYGIAYYKPYDEDIHTVAVIRLTITVSGEEGISEAFADSDDGDREAIPVLVIKNPDGTSTGMIAGSM